MGDSQMKELPFYLPSSAGWYTASNCAVICLLSLIACFCIMLVLLMLFSSSYIGALQIVTPNKFCGQMFAICFFVVSLVGFDVSLVVFGAITDFGFGDRTRVGWSIAAFIGFGGASAFVLLNLTRARMHRAMQACRQWV